MATTPRSPGAPSRKEGAARTNFHIAVRTVIETVQAIEHELATHAAKDSAAIQHEHKDMTSVELARRFEEIIAEAAKKLAAPKA